MGPVEIRPDSATGHEAANTVGAPPAPALNAAVGPAEVAGLTYVQFMALLEETNRPPGGLAALLEVASLCNINQTSRVLDIGCNTGYVALELAAYRGCEVLGIDISTEMIGVAARRSRCLNLRERARFLVADATRLPFPADLFHVVVCGGSLAFMTDGQQALYEAIRVALPRAFLIDIEFYYRCNPPESHLTELSGVLGFEILPRKLDHWLNFYNRAGLEQVQLQVREAPTVAESVVRGYAETMVERVRHKFTPAGAVEAVERLTAVMCLFNRNQSYLNYASFVFRRREDGIDPILFM